MSPAPSPDNGDDDTNVRMSRLRSVVEAAGASWEPPARGRWVQLVFRPTFHPPLVVTVEGDEEEALLHAAAPPASAAGWAFHHLPVRPPDDVGPEEAGQARPASTVLVVDRPELDAVWTAVERLHGCGPQSGGGRDGVVVQIRLKQGHDIVVLESWQPEPGALERPLIEHLLRPVAESGDTPVASLAREIRHSLSLP